MGPALVFDKSTLESLNVDESLWLDHFFICNITPLFYVESLADLDKNSSDKRSSETLVRDLANKTPDEGAANIAHHTLILQELLGNKVQMDGRPIIGGGEPRIDSDGKIGIYHDHFPEMEAFGRWQKREFHKVEQEFAKDWRNIVSNLNFDYTIGILKNTVPTNTKISSVNDLKIFVDQFVEGNYKELLILALDTLGMPPKFYDAILSKWEKKGHPRFNDFAPYASFCFKIDLFFYLALDKSFISRDRPSNKIDISYLYYLPFCNVFTSKDNLHRRIAPLFMENGQTFVWGEDIKKSLREIDNEFSKLPEEIKKQGLFKFANYPPDDITSVVPQMWDKYCRYWRKHKKEKENAPDRDVMNDKKLIEHLNNLEKNAEALPKGFKPPLGEPDHIMFKRKMRIKKGKWSIFPPEVLKQAKKDGDLD